LHPGYKFIWFKEKWTLISKLYALALIKTKLRRLWEGIYKKDNVLESIENPCSPKKQCSYLESVLDKMAPSNRSRVIRPIHGKNKLFLYLAEPITDRIGLMEYWKSREAQWPCLAQMAYDFLSILAMSSKCERVFSSCAKQTTPKSSRLSRRMLWHQEYVKNWQRRGAIRMETFKYIAILDL
jgi:hypothetical protein